MSGVFKRVSDSNSYDGGSQSQCRYRHKCDFKKSRNGRLNENNMQCARLIKAVFIIVSTILYGVVALAQVMQGFNPLGVTITYYSLWGAVIALFA